MSYPNNPPGSYPQYPSAGGYQQGPPPVAKAPGSVTGAFFIYLLAALIALVGVVITLTSDYWDTIIRDETAKAAVQNQITDVESVVNAAKIILIVIGVVLLALYLLFAFKMRAGRNWARIVLTVLSALSILSPFSASGSVTINGTTYSGSTTQTTGYIGAAVAVVAIVLMFLPASNAYFQAKKIEKARGILNG